MKSKQESKMNDEFFKSVLEENKQAVKDKIRESILESVSSQFRYNIPESIRGVMDEFIKSEILPELKLVLAENRDAILEATKGAVSGIAVETAKALQEKAALNLTHSWNVRAIAEAIFK